MASTKARRDGKNELLRAAARAFAHRTYAEVGVSDVLNESGVKAPSLYHHFGDKEGLYVAWAESAFDQWGERIQGLSESDAPIEALTRLAEAIGEFDGLDLNRTLDSCRRLERGESRKRIERAYVAAIVEPVCLALMSAQDRGAISIDSVEKAAATFIATALSASSRTAMPASGADSNYRWQVQRFVFGFVRPLP